MRGGMTSRQQLRSDIVEHMKHTHPNALHVQHRARASGSAPIREDPDMKGCVACVHVHVYSMVLCGCIVCTAHMIVDARFPSDAARQEV